MAAEKAVFRSNASIAKELKMTTKDLQLFFERHNLTRRKLNVKGPQLLLTKAATNHQVFISPQAKKVFESDSKDFGQRLAPVPERNQVTDEEEYESSSSPDLKAETI